MKSKKETENPAIDILSVAWRDWANLNEMRINRIRNKDFSFGRQYNDAVTLSDGRTITEREHLHDAHVQPLTNNIIRQLVKTVVGRFRASLPDDADALISELDSRMFEEFLLSGCCVQRIDEEKITNVSPARIFCNAYSDPLARDCTRIGMLHDMTLDQILLRFADGDDKQAERICRVYGTSLDEQMNSIRELSGDHQRNPVSSFWQSRVNGMLRVIEVWTLDLLREKGDDKSAKWHYAQKWRCHWLTPTGEILKEYFSPYAHTSHPFVIKMYPLTDGEIHSFVEDVIDQQKHINRLISLTDHIMMSSAKGVLLYPTEGLPAGFTWDDIIRLWRTPGSIIPFNGDSQPMQFAINATNIGAHELLKVELEMFQRVSGVSDALQGKSSSGTVGAELYRQQTENANVALSDILDTFKSFLQLRDAKLNGSRR